MVTLSVSAVVLIGSKEWPTYPQEVMTEDLPVAASEAVTPPPPASPTNSAIFSITSNSNLLVPGKLYSDLTVLKKSYCDLIRTIDPSNKGEDSEVLLLTKEQMAAGVKKHKADIVRSFLVDLLDVVRPVCLPDYEEDSRPKQLPHEVAVASLCSRVEGYCKKSDDRFDKLTTELGYLRTTISEYETSAKLLGSTSGQASSSPPSLIEISEDISLTTEHHQKHIELYDEEYLSVTEASDVFRSLQDLRSYNVRNGRGTVQFGVPYKYPGSKGDPQQIEFPVYLKKILDKLNEKFAVENVPPLNSCLVTRYSGPDAYIPDHSDSERSLHPESSIYTISLGKDSVVHFADTHNGKQHQQPIKIGSLYAMTKKSQSCFSHGIRRDASWGKDDTRISLTFRSLHWRNFNSTVILGDSNTGGLKFANFGGDPTKNMNGTFGNAMPGKQVSMFLVDKLDAVQSLGYNNIVIHCGINSIKGDDCLTEDDVRSIYAKFKGKVGDVVNLNKRSRVFISTLLPTKLDILNKKVRIFNHLLNVDLVRSFSNVFIIDNTFTFSDGLGKLSRSISRDTNRNGDPDNLHLNENGLRLLSRNIKRAIFFRKESRASGGDRDEGGGPGRGYIRRDNRGMYSGAVEHGYQSGGGQVGGGRGRHPYRPRRGFPPR